MRSNIANGCELLRCYDILFPQVWMICDDLFNCHPSCKLAQDLLDRNTCALYYWFSEHYVWVNLNLFISFHHLLHALPLFVKYEGQFGSASNLLSVTFLPDIPDNSNGGRDQGQFGIVNLGRHGA